MKKHLKHTTTDYFYKQPYKDTLILMFLKKYNIIFIIDINPPNDLKEASKKNRANIRCLQTLHGCLSDASIIFCPVLLYSETKVSDISTAACKNRKKLGLVTSRKIFEDQALLKPLGKNNR